MIYVMEEEAALGELHAARISRGIDAIQKDLEQAGHV